MYPTEFRYLPSIAGNFVMSSLFAYYRHLSGMPWDENLGKFVFAFLLGSVLCVAAIHVLYKFADRL